MENYEPFAKKKKVKTAVAIGYNSKKDFAPKILAMGKNSLAEKIIQEAEKFDIHVEQNQELVELLSIVEVNEHIPKQAYEAIAKILVYIYNKKAKHTSL
jgi:flagellar biosynthesis protein